MISSPAPAPQPLHHHSHSREPLDARGEIEAGVVLLHRPLSLLLVPAEDAVDVCDGSARDIARVPRHLVREPSVRMVGKLDDRVARLVFLNRELEVLRRMAVQFLAEYR